MKKEPVRILIAIGIVMTFSILAWILQPSDTSTVSASESTSIWPMIIGIVFILSVFCFFGYKIWQKIGANITSLYRRVTPSSTTPASFATFKKTILSVVKLVLLLIALCGIWRIYQYCKNSHGGKIIVVKKGVPFKFYKIPGKEYRFYCDKGPRQLCIQPVNNDDDYICGVVNSYGFHPFDTTKTPTKANGKFMVTIDSTAELIMVVSNPH